MGTQRDGIYVHPTWLAKFMGGEITCDWQVWFKAHNYYDKIPSDFDVASYKMNHGRALRELRDEHRGKELLVERQGGFQWRRPGSDLVIGGTPDLIVVEDQAVTVYDVKTGIARDWHPIQVMIYMRCLKDEAPVYRDRLLQGVVKYTDHEVFVPPTALDTDFESNFNYYLDIIASTTPPDTSPSEMECQWCDLPKTECADRVEMADESAGDRPYD